MHIHIGYLWIMCICITYIRIYTRMYIYVIMKHSDMFQNNQLDPTSNTTKADDSIIIHGSDRVPNPTLGTIKMVEETLSKMSEYPTKNKLWRALPRQIQYPSLKVILEYLAESNKVVFDKNNKIVWLFSENQKLRQLKESSKSVFAQ